MSTTFAFDAFVGTFPDLVAATGGAKLLRELILSLGVRGLLTSRQKSDGAVGVPACSSSEDAPFEIPATWQWARLGDLGRFLGGGTPSKANTAFWKGPIPWVSPKDMKRPYIDDAEDHISKAAIAGSAVNPIPERSLLFVVRGMILAHSFPTAVTTREVTINQDMKALTLTQPDTADYLLRVCQDAKRRVLQQVERSSHGTCRLDTKVIENLLVPLPPVAEQKRIVERVDQLMALIDELEAKQTRKRDLSTRFTKSALDALTTAEGPEEFDAAWTRVVENWDVVLDRSEKVGELRAAILELAVRGSLGTRDASDRPAQHLIAEIATARANRDGGAASRMPPTIDNELLRPELFALPSTWEWVAVASAFDVGGGIQKTPLRKPKEHHFPYLRVENVQRGRLDLERMERFELQEGELERWQLKPGDLLVVEGNGSEREIGRCALWNGEIDQCVHQNHIIRCRPNEPAWSPFMLLFLNSPSGKSEMRRLAITTSGLFSLSVGKIRGISFPMPPLEEQKRIVAKVEQLMKVCDDLEAKLRRAEDRAAKLVEAVVQEMVAGRSDSAEDDQGRNAPSAGSAPRSTDAAAPPRTPGVPKQEELFPDVRPPWHSIKATDRQVSMLALIVDAHARADRLHTLGDIKAEKILHVLGARSGIDLGREAKQEAAGPADVKALKAAIKRGQHKYVFAVQPGSRTKKAEWSPGRGLNKWLREHEPAFMQERAEIDRVLGLMVPLDVEGAEIVATLHEAWSKLLAGDAAVTDDAIINAFFLWSERKARYDRTRVEKALVWMRDNDLAPTGGPRP